MRETVLSSEGEGYTDYWRTRARATISTCHAMATWLKDLAVRLERSPGANSDIELPLVLAALAEVARSVRLSGEGYGDHWRGQSEAVFVVADGLRAALRLAAASGTGAADLMQALSDPLSELRRTSDQVQPFSPGLRAQFWVDHADALVQSCLCTSISLNQIAADQWRSVR